MKKIIKNIIKENNVERTAKQFFIVAKTLANKWDDQKFEYWSADNDPWERNQVIEEISKLVGLTSLSDLSAAEIFWLAYDNKEGLRDGTIKSYLGLTERNLNTYSVRLSESENEYVFYEYDVLVEAYDKQDVINKVYNDDDGEYHWWEWETDWYKSSIPNGYFHREVVESEITDNDVLGEPKLVSIVDNTSRKGSLKEQIKASPVENDILSELKELITTWDGCEEGMPVACKYKNQVQRLIDQYKNKGLYEHMDNFVSHSYEPEIGDNVVNTNPGCIHYKSEGFIEDIEDLPDDVGKIVTYVVNNNGESYKEGDRLIKTLDQIEPLKK